MMTIQKMMAALALVAFFAASTPVMAADSASESDIGVQTETAGETKGNPDTQKEAVAAGENGTQTVKKTFSGELVLAAGEKRYVEVRDKLSNQRARVNWKGVVTAKKKGRSVLSIRFTLGETQYLYKQKLRIYKVKESGKITDKQLPGHDGQTELFLPKRYLREKKIYGHTRRHALPGQGCDCEVRSEAGPDEDAVSEGT